VGKIPNEKEDLVCCWFMTTTTTASSTPSLPAIPTVLQDLFGIIADQLARDTKLIQRQGIFTGSTLTQGLVFGLMANPKASLTELAQSSCISGASVTPQAIAQRLEQSKTGIFFKTLFEKALTCLFPKFSTVQTAHPRVLPDTLAIFKDIEISDGTTINLPAHHRQTYPGCGSEGSANYAGIKLLTRFSYLTGAIDIKIEPAKKHDYITSEVNMERVGTLVLRDLGFFNLKTLAAENKMGIYWISRIKSATRIYDAETGKSIDDVAKWLRKKAGDSGQVDALILLGKAEKIPCRLIAVRVPDEVYEGRVKEAYKEAGKRQKPRDYYIQEELRWNIRVTNLAQETFSLESIFIIYQIRWQIELLFKLFKSENLIDESRSKNPERCLTEVFIKLLGVLVQQWCLIETGWEELENSVTLLSRVVRNNVSLLRGVITGDVSYAHFKMILLAGMSKGCRLQTRKKCPSTTQKVKALKTPQSLA
jgi:Transposase DDE domain